MLASAHLLVLAPLNTTPCNVLLWAAANVAHALVLTFVCRAVYFRDAAVVPVCTAISHVLPVIVSAVHSSMIGSPTSLVEAMGAIFAVVGSAVAAVPLALQLSANHSPCGRAFGGSSSSDQPEKGNE